MEARGVCAYTCTGVGGGCTGVVTGVAQRLTAMGARVLVVDANTLALNSPLQHGGLGLTDHLAGRAALADIVVRNSPALPGIALVGIGSARAGGLQHIDRLRLALQTWQEEYDLVLLDVPPLLPSADAELLIDVAKQVFLVVEALGVTKAELAQVRAKLSQQAPEAVGLVVNKVAMEQGSATLHQHILEGLTGGRFSRFMSMPDLHLRFELLRIHIRRAFKWRGRQAEAWQAG